MASDLVLYYQFEQTGKTVVDSSGYNNHGQIYGAARNVGKFGNGLTFDGVNDYVGISDSASLRIITEISIFAWIKPITIALTRPIITKQAEVFGLFIDIAGGLGADLVFYMRDAAFTLWAHSSNLLTFASGVWNFVGATYDGATLTFYVNNGTQVVAFAHGNISAAPFNLRVGATLVAPLLYINSVVDELRVYNRALSSQEARSLYNSVIPVPKQLPKRAPEPPIPINLLTSFRDYLKLKVK